MAERVCSPEDNAASAKLAGTGKRFGPALVEIVDVNRTNRLVKFRTTGCGGTPVEVQCPWTRDSVWELCPSTLEHGGDGLPVDGATGTMYLSRGLVDAHHLAVNVKWPDALPGRVEYRPLRIWPTSVDLRGVELATGTMTSATIDLLDPDLAAPDQTISLGARPVTLRLSQHGFFRFFAPWRSLAELENAAAILTSRAGTARDKARAWAQIAAWEEALASPAAHESDELATARRVLERLAG